MGVLQKINRKMRKIQTVISLFAVYVNHHFWGYGFGLLTIEYDMEPRSLLLLTARLPIRYDQKVSIEWDFLFLRNYIRGKVSDIYEDMLWNKGKVKWHQRIFYRLFKCMV